MIILAKEVEEHYEWDDDLFDEKEEEVKEQPKKKKETKSKKEQDKKKEKSSININYIVIAIAFIALIAYSAYVIYSENGNTPSEESGLRVDIDGKIINENEINTRYDLLFFLQGYPEEYKNVISIGDFINDSLINEELLVEEARLNGIELMEGEAEKALQDSLDANSITEAQLVSDLESNGLSKQDILDYFERRAMIDIYLSKYLMPQINVTDDEVQDYYDSNPDLFTTPEAINVSHILVDTEEEAEEIKALLDAGEDFEELARERSTGPSAPYGGNLGFIVRSQTVPAFEDAAFSLEEGDISDIVETDYGYHIIKLNERNEEGIVELDDALKENIREALKAEKSQIVARELLEQLRNKADIKIYTGDEEQQESNESSEAVEPESVFLETGDEICYHDEKPIVRLYSAAIDPHSQWIKQAYEDVTAEFGDEIVAYNWEIDSGDNTISAEIEESIPKSEFEIYKKYNSAGTVPTFIIGCKYIRVGNAYEKEGNIELEKEELRNIIQQLL